MANPRFFGKKDLDTFDRVNKELIGDLNKANSGIIDQTVIVYKISANNTETNMYGETSDGKVFRPGVEMACLVEAEDMAFNTDEFGPDSAQNVNFQFHRNTLIKKEAAPEVGDIILYEEGYYEVDDVITNQLFVGKDPRYPNKPNPFENDLDKFGYDVSIICKTHSVPSDKVGISRERLI